MPTARISHLRLHSGARMEMASVGSLIGCGSVLGRQAANHTVDRNSPLKTSGRSGTRGKRACNDVGVSATPAQPPFLLPDRDIADASSQTDMPRLLVVSHPAVVSVNQEVYRELMRRGWAVTIVVPDRWRHEYCGLDGRAEA